MRAAPLAPAVCYALFLVSGFSALLYEIVWTRQLILIFGAAVPSTSVILAGFMAGMALGSWLGGRLARRCPRPLELYGKLELGIAVCGLAFPAALAAVTRFYEATTLPPQAVRLAMVFSAILPATTLMGATFPVLGQSFSGEESGIRLARLYAANLVGACLGVLGTAFVLLAFLGLSGTHRLGVALNVCAGLAALALRHVPAAEMKPPGGNPAPWAARTSVLVSGFCGMGMEVVWTRLLTPGFNNSAYGFASVLVVFLLGLGSGSWAVSRARKLDWRSVGMLQMLAALLGYVGYRLLEITQLVQLRFDMLAASTISPVIGAPLAEVLLVVGPMAFLQGMVLPAALRPCADAEGPGAAAGALCFWSTVGGIAGSLAAGFWWIPRWGVQNALLACVAVGAASGAALASWGSPAGLLRYAYPLACAAGLAWMSASLQGRLLSKDILLDWLNRGSGGVGLSFYEDDLEASVAVVDRGGGNRHLVINGVGVTGYAVATKMMAHIPLALHPSPERALVICFGMGTTFRSAMRHGVRVDAVDLVPSVFSAFPHFYPDAQRWLSDPKARLLVNDGRNHLLRDREGYDVIVVDPSPPLYSAGTVNIYSRDFFALGLRRLKPGGLMAVWLLEWPETEFKMVMRGFFAAMPHAQVWRVPGDGGIILLGSGAPINYDRGRVAEILRKPGVRDDLAELAGGPGDEERFSRLFLGTGLRFKSYVSGAPEVTDEFPWIEYPYFRSRTPAYLKHPAVFKWDPPGPGEGLPLPAR